MRRTTEKGEEQREEKVPVAFDDSKLFFRLEVDDDNPRRLVCHK